MTRYWRTHTLRAWTCALALGCTGAPAGELAVRVLTDRGEPLADAVVWLSPAAPVPSPRPAVMDQIDKNFVPYILPVPTGTVVDFPNSDSINHHVYSFSPAKRFELKLAPGANNTHTVRFDKPGVVTLGCNIHDWMLGYIVVVDSSAFGQTDSQGSVRLNVPDGARQINVWHPRLAEAPQPLVQPLTGAAGLDIRLTRPLKPDLRRASHGYH